MPVRRRRAGSHRPFRPGIPPFFNQPQLFFPANGWIKSSKELKRRIRGYFYRWGVEESYRFEKQSFGIEKSTVRNYDRIKSLIGLNLFPWLLLVKAKQHAKVKQAKPEKTKKKQKYETIKSGMLHSQVPLSHYIGHELFSFEMVG